MSHNATYGTSIVCADKETLELALKWLEQNGILRLVDNIRVYGYGAQSVMKATGIGVQLMHETYGIDVTISHDGTVMFTGENMAEREFMVFKDLLEQTYEAVVARMKAIEMGFETEMQIIEEKGEKVIELLGVD